jgi:hypothetical protein
MMMMNYYFCHPYLMVSPLLESASERSFISSLQAPIPIDETIHEQLCRDGSVGLWESSST